MFLPSSKNKVARCFMYATFFLAYLIILWLHFFHLCQILFIYVKCWLLALQVTNMCLVSLECDTDLKGFRRKALLVQNEILTTWLWEYILYEKKISVTLFFFLNKLLLVMNTTFKKVLFVEITIRHFNWEQTIKSFSIFDKFNLMNIAKLAFRK